MTFERYIVFVSIILFGAYFAFNNHFLLSYLCLPLLLVMLRIESLRNLTINREGFNFQLDKLNMVKDRVETALKKKKAINEKVLDLQKLIDEAFKYGFLFGGGKVRGDIENVQISRDEKGDIIEVHYEEKYS